jgi:DinB superfamily
MSLADDRKPQHLEPDRLNPAQGTPILSASVEATRGTDLCTSPASGMAAREHILAWLAGGAREVNLALCSLARERWATAPPAPLGSWPALRHARHIALRETHLTLPAVRRALEEESPAGDEVLEFERADAAWDAASALASAEDTIRSLGETRFELLERLEAAPDDAWQRHLPTPQASADWGDASPIQLDWLLLTARQHELEHLAAMWRVALHWDRAPRVPIHGVPLHPADRLEESH